MDAGKGALGEPCTVYGRVSGTDGQPIAGAGVETWQADADGHFDVQYGDPDRPRGCGVVKSGEGRRFHFKTIVAGKLQCHRGEEDEHKSIWESRTGSEFAYAVPTWEDGDGGGVLADMRVGDCDRRWRQLVSGGRR
ncbi:dioxygenase family protein [Cupriavidus sp. 8B]